MSRLQVAAILGSLAASASAHGIVQGIVAGGKWYSGYNPSFQYADPPPTVIGWSIPEDQDIGFVAPSSFSDPDIICHKGATPGGASAKVEAGSVVELQWTDWPESHHGPVIDYLAKCSGSCTNADKTSLEFFKIDQGGLIDGSTPPGTWASDQLIANNQSWVVTIPKSIAPGNYVLRHEIIALHSAGNEDGAQNYPQCINLEITGSGSDSPSGELGTALYKADDPGILINIYTELSSYKIPGPSLIAGAVSMKQTTIPFNGAGTVSTAPAASGSSAPVASATSVAPESSGSAPAPSSSVAAASSSAAPPSYGAPAPSSSVAAPASGSASASVSYPLSSSAAPASDSCTQTITISGKPSSSSIVAPVSSSAVVASSSASYPAPPLPSSGPASYVAPAQSSSSAAPSSAASSAAPTPSSPPAPPPKYPADKPIPKGFTFGDLLAWLKYTVRVVYGKGSKKHARDFRMR